MRYVEVSMKATDEQGDTMQETIFRQYFKTKDQQVVEQKALFPAVAGTVQSVMEKQP
jgi:hypothetical protein